VEEIARLFTGGKVVDGDHFLFTDAWHPGIINLKYMAELLGIKIKIHALWHAGSYDPQDFLGRLIGDADWVRHSEKAFFHAIDYNYFATDFHIDMFCFNLFKCPRWMFEGKIFRTGWPMEYMSTEIVPFQTEKRDLILFPHRLAPEKQVEIFKDLALALPQYEWVICQEQNLTKEAYHTLLGEAKLVFSANLQETLGISWYEGAIVDAIPMVPDRLSYSEMALDDFKYPSKWTESFDTYKQHKQEIIDKINNYMKNYNSFLPALKTQTHLLTENFFSATNLLENIK
jgi:hypothetical protein